MYGKNTRVLWCVKEDWGWPACQPPQRLQNSACRYRSSLYRVHWLSEVTSWVRSGRAVPPEKNHGIQWGCTGSGYWYTVKFRCPVVSGKILPDNISAFVIGETSVKTLERELKSCFSLWRRANARNVRLHYPYWQYTDLFIFRFVSLLCLRSTLRLNHVWLVWRAVPSFVDYQTCPSFI